MFHFISGIHYNLQAIVEHGGYAFLFITTVLEGIPVIGQFIPGHTIVIIAGFLSKLHLLNPIIVTIIVIVSAMLGDLVGFMLGRKYGFNFLIKFGSFFFLKKEHIEKAQKLIKEHPAKTIILGRFSPITRPLSPFIVGASGTDQSKFWLFDFIAVFFWSVLSVAIGYIFGASYHAVSAVLGKYIVLAIIIGILITWGYRFINKQFHIFAKYELITLGFNLFGLYLFFKTIQDALTDKVFLLELDLYVNNFFLLHSNPICLVIMNIITNILSPLSITIAGFIATIYFIYRKNLYYAFISAVSLGGGYLFTFVIKNVVMRLRPEYGYVLESGYSFPSGHAVAATIFFTLVIYFFIIKINSQVWREISVVACVLLIILTGFSRVYLGVHWLSDVFAGIGFGLFWTTFVILTLKYMSMIAKMVKNRFFA